MFCIWWTCPPAAVVRFTNEREDKVFTTVLALPNLRLTPTDKTAFQWWETPRGNPRALRAWFYPGDSFGHEFVYPKGLAVRIARDTGGPVLMAPSLAETELATAPVTEIDNAGEEVPLEEAFVSEAPAAPVEIAKAEFEPEPAPAPEPIPPTASPYFAFGLAGLFLATAGWALRKIA